MFVIHKYYNESCHFVSLSSIVNDQANSHGNIRRKFKEVKKWLTNLKKKQMPNAWDRTIYAYTQQWYFTKMMKKKKLIV